MNLLAGLLADAHRFHPLPALRRIGPIRSALERADRPIWGRIPGVEHPVRMDRVGHISYRVLRNGPEPETRAAFLNLSSDGVFWDVGANMGYYSWLRGNGVLFEPDPISCSLIRATIDRSSLKGFELVPNAVSAMSGLATFARIGEGGARSALVTGDGVVVQTIALDTRTDVPSIVKIDVEGHELEVLAGARRVLVEHRPVVICELSTGDGAARVLEELGYSVTILDGINALGRP